MLPRLQGARSSLTASTRSNEVFPAFCNPIIVMSISVALDHTSRLVDMRQSGAIDLILESNNTVHGNSPSVPGFLVIENVLTRTIAITSHRCS